MNPVPPCRTQVERTRVSREKIIQSATEEFSQKGFRGAKMADIAKAADLTKSGLLHHFPSKTHLVMEAIKERDRIEGERTKAVLQKTTLMEPEKVDMAHIFRVFVNLLKKTEA
jgi:AcrR family transcriptional regulator